MIKISENNNFYVFNIKVRLVFIAFLGTYACQRLYTFWPFPQRSTSWKSGHISNKTIWKSCISGRSQKPGSLGDPQGNEIPLLLIAQGNGVQPDKLAITLASTKKYGLLVINMNKQGGIKLFISMIENICFLVVYICTIIPFFCFL